MKRHNITDTIHRQLGEHGMNKKMTSLLLGMTMAFCMPIQPTIYAEEVNTVQQEDNEIKEETDTVQEDHVKQEEESSKESMIDEEEQVEEESISASDIGETFHVNEDETISKLIMTIGKKQAILDGTTYTLQTAPKIIKERTYLPLRFVAENILKAQVDFNHSQKQIVIHKVGMRVILEVGKNIAIVNGEKVDLDGEPVIEASTTLVPLRFLGETFGLQVDYHHTQKQVILSKKQEITTSNKAPTAHFSFKKESYSEGETIELIEDSYDEDGDRIVARNWELSGKGSSQDVSSLLKNLKAGTYELTLKVKDEKGLWSSAYAQSLVIIPNKPPVITTFSTQKTSYAQGEALSFDYTYDNEEGEGISKERWTYRSVNEASNQAVITKPYAFFAPGEYIVTLELTDAAGKVSEEMQTTVHITKEVKQTEWAYHFTQGKIGDTIDNYQGINYRNYKTATIKSQLQNQDTLWMSDSPEVVTTNGILYKGDFTGEGRVLLHHINGFNENVASEKRFVLVAENNEEEPITIRISQEVIKGPVEDVLYLGQQVLYDYWKSNLSRTITLAPGQKVALYDSKNKIWLKEQCISGIMNLETNGTVQLTTAVMDRTDDLNQLDTLPLLDKSIHVRGTFEGTVRYYDLDIEKGKSTQIVLGETPEEWVSGADAITGEWIQNKGNFGVTYRLTLTAQEDTGIILNPRADVFRGAIKWVDTDTYLAPNAGYFMGQNKKAVLLGVIKKGETRVLEYMLPNGSSAPVLLGFIPKSQW